MLAGPLVFLVVSVVLWRYGGAVLMPKQLSDRLFDLLPALGGSFIEYVVFYNFVLIYFGAYFAFAFYWARLKRFRILRHPFVAAFVLWCVNVFVIFPIAGRGIFGYKMPQGPFSASLFLFASHWVFGRMLERQERLAAASAPILFP
jgi:hypothetical protein